MSVVLGKLTLRLGTNEISVIKEIDAEDIGVISE